MDDTLQSVKHILVGLNRDGRQQRRSDGSPAARFIKAVTVAFLAKHALTKYDSVLKFAEELYGRGIEHFAPSLVRAIAHPEQVFKTAVNPAATTVAGWAAELVGVDNFAGPLASLAPTSLYAQLSALGPRARLLGNNTVKFAGRAPTPSMAGAFTGENAAIRVVAGGLSTVSVTGCKLAVISSFSNELAMRSVPDVQQTIRQALAEDTSLAVDTALADATASSSVRPAGLLNGVTPLTATTGGGAAALAGDLSVLAGAIVRPSALIYLMPAAERVRALCLAPGLIAAPILEAPLPAKQIAAVDAADFCSAEGDEPELSVFTEGVVHEEDTTPLAIGTPGAPATIAAPVRSLWQTDTSAIRLRQYLGWAMRRGSRIATITAVTW